ncbi:MAG: hypothetical protein ACQSGP_16965 [Frankia sp.]
MTEPADPYAEGPEDALLDPEEGLDSDNLGELENGRDPLDDAWDPPDRLSAAERYGTTATEQRDGESLDALLAAEEPDIDPYAEAERTESGAVLESDVADVRPSRPGELIDDTGSSGRVSPLVEDNEGAHPDETAELVAHETGSRPGSETDLGAEDDALHLDPDD